MIAILLATWKEIYRKKVFLVTLLMTVGLLVLIALATSFVSHQTAGSLSSTSALNVYLEGSVMFALSLYGANFSVAYLSIFTATGTIASEIESGLLLAMLPRPIRRWQIYLGKWMGYTLWSIAYSGVMFWSLAIIIHINMHFPVVWHVLSGAFLLSLLIPVILVSITMLGSTYLPTLGNGILIILLYGLGLFGDLLERAGLGNTLATHVDKIGFLTNLMMPTDAVYQRVTFDVVGGVGSSLFGMAAQFVGKGVMPVLPSATFMGYAAAYAAVMLVWGMFRFSTRDI